MMTIRLHGVDVPITSEWFNPSYRAGIRHCFAVLAGVGSGLSSHLFEYEGTSLYIDSDMWHIAAALLEMTSDERIRHGWIDLFPHALMMQTRVRHHPPELSGARQAEVLKHIVPHLGVPELDRDHAEIAQVMTALDECCQQNRGPGEVLTLVRHLPVVASRHFRREEELMRSSNYPLLASHHREHNLMLEIVNGITDQLAAERIRLDDAVMSDLWEWENYHVISADQNYVDFLRKEQAQEE
jgi:hemerythrin